jgi:hypothetical protein
VTPRKALRGLLAVPYWTLALILGGVLCQAAPDPWGVSAAAVVGLVAGVAQGVLLGRLAGYIWGHVEVLAKGWRELTRATADNPPTSRNGVDNTEAER